MANNINFKTAVEIASGIKNKSFSVLEVMKSHLNAIKQTNKKVNAIVSLDEEGSLAKARAADHIISEKDNNVGALFGLSVAVKDTHHAKGFKTTMGSEIYSNQVANMDHTIVDRMKRAGAIVIGKTNVPEFAAGSHTFNKIFGPTRNPYDLTKSAGGSSGGAAAALASGMIPLADGSDMGGSCRNPAAYNNVVGLRPSPGRIPSYPKRSLYSPLVVQGPLARTVSDVALMMSVVTGFDRRSPLWSEYSPEVFKESLNIETKRLKIGYSYDLGGSFPVAINVRQQFEKQLEVFANLGCEVEEASPNFENAREIFQTLRALEYVINYREVYKKQKEKMKTSVIWNIEKGLKLSGTDIAHVKNLKADLYESVHNFFKKYDFLILPVSQVQPFDIEIEYPTQINNIKMNNYIEWMESCSHITVTGSPAISVPAGFCEDGLPFGLQIVAPFNDDFKLLQIAYAFEQATKYGQKKPNL